MRTFICRSPTYLLYDLTVCGIDSFVGIISCGSAISKVRMNITGVFGLKPRQCCDFHLANSSSLNGSSFKGDMLVSGIVPYDTKEIIGEFFE